MSSCTVKPLTFISAWFCPYAQRAWIALNYKRIPFEIVEGLQVDKETQEYIKHPQLLAANPSGLVPVIVHPEKSNKVVTESLLCVEFADEFKSEEDVKAQSRPSANSLLEFTLGSLFPVDPFDRALCRRLCEHYNRAICSAFYSVIMAQEEDKYKQNLEKLRQNVRAFTDSIQGSLYFGEQLSAVDVAVFPWIFRLPILEHYQRFGADADIAQLSYIVADNRRGELRANYSSNGPSHTNPKRQKTEDAGNGDQAPWEDKLREWLKRCMREPAIQDTLPPWNDLVEIYARYADGTAKSKVGDAIRNNKDPADVK